MLASGDRLKKFLILSSAKSFFQYLSTIKKVASFETSEQSQGGPYIAKFSSTRDRGGKGMKSSGGMYPHSPLAHLCFEVLPIDILNRYL